MAEEYFRWQSMWEENFGHPPQPMMTPEMGVVWDVLRFSKLSPVFPYESRISSSLVSNDFFSGLSGGFVENLFTARAK